MWAQVENIYPVGVIAQLVERRVRNAEVWSSILHGSTIFPFLSEKISCHGPCTTFYRANNSRTSSLIRRVDELPCNLSIWP